MQQLVFQTTSTQSMLHTPRSIILKNTACKQELQRKPPTGVVTVSKINQQSAAGTYKFITTESLYRRVP